MRQSRQTTGRLRSTWPIGLVVALAVCGRAEAGSSVPPIRRIWQPRGRVDIEATLAGQSAKSVRLLAADGSTRTVSKKELPTEDLRYLRNLALAREPFRTWRPKEMPEFKACLVDVTGFDSVRSKRCAILVRANGRRRGYPVDIFSEEDREYVGRFERKLAKRPRPPARNVGAAYKVLPDRYDKLPKGEVNTHGTRHFRFFWGNESKGSGKRWFAPEFREMNYRYFEKKWDFFENEMQAPMPYDRSNEKFKVNVYVTGTGLKWNKEGWAFGAKHMVLHPNGMQVGSAVTPHEFGHAMQYHSGGCRGYRQVGWFWECHAQWCCHQFIPSQPVGLGGFPDHANLDLASFVHRYTTWSFLQHMAEHPRIGPWFCFKVWPENRKNDKDHSIETPFQTILRVGAEEGIFAGPTGAEGFADVVGETAARNVTWDYVYRYFYRKATKEPAGKRTVGPRRRTALEPVPDRPGWYRPPAALLPRQYGYNVIDLSREPGRSVVVVDLQGVPDPREGAEWRATIVAIDADGEPRYGRMWNAGRMEMRLRRHEKRLALVVAATPLVYRPVSIKKAYNSKITYPYEVFFQGCKPRPTPQISDEAKGEGKPHPNGGGFVATSATVAPSAYVGPNALVLGKAKVLDNARVCDRAMVRGSATVSGSARVRDHAVVEGNILVTEHARVIEHAKLRGRGKVGGSAVLRGLAVVDPVGTIGGSAIVGADAMYAGDKGKVVAFGLMHDWTRKNELRKVKDHAHLYARWTFDDPGGSVLRDRFAANDMILRGSPSFEEEGDRSFVRLNGRDQYAVLGRDLVDAPELTIDAVIRWNGGVAEQRLFEFAGENDRIYFTPRRTGGGSCFALVGGGGRRCEVRCAQLPRGKWLRLALVSAAGRLAVHVDGKALGVVDGAELRPGDLAIEHGFLGNSLGSGRPFRGDIDTIEIRRTGLPKRR